MKSILVIALVPHTGLAHSLNLPANMTARVQRDVFIACESCRLTGFFKALGVKAVLDTSTGRDIALLEAAAEFIQRYKAAHPDPAQNGRLTSCLAV